MTAVDGGVRDAFARQAGRLDSAPFPDHPLHMSATTPARERVRGTTVPSRINGSGGN